jgi:hypothetical protein
LCGYRFKGKKNKEQPEMLQGKSVDDESLYSVDVEKVKVDAKDKN